MLGRQAPIAVNVVNGTADNNGDNTMDNLKTAIASAVIAISFAMPAEARINTTNLSCNQAKDLVYSRGAIVLSTGRNTYDRFVRNRSFCPISDYTKRAYVRTRDRRSCNIGYTCTSDDPWEIGRD